MKLRDLLAGIEGAATTRWAVDGNDDGRAPAALDVEVAEVRDDSRLVQPGDLFAAVPGTAADGATFLADAIARGARAVVIEAAAGSARPAALDGYDGVCVTVPRARQALGVIAANRYQAAQALALIAVTGTNGKTTTTYLNEAMLRAAGHRPGVIGTVTYRVSSGGVSAHPTQGPDGAGGGHADASGIPSARTSGLGAATLSFSRPAPLTTPGALALHGLFAEMRDAGATDVVLEASSHALHQGRLDGCRFRVAGLTNLTQDHLDYHGSMEAYFEAKSILFERLLDPQAGVAVLPVDRPEGRAMRDHARGRAVLGVSSRPLGPGGGADVVVERVEASSDGMRLRLGTPVGPLDLNSSLVGTFNLENIVLSVGMAIGRGLDRDAIVAGIAGLPGVPGRLERVANDRGVLCVVDYAHTPDALERAIAAVRPLVAPGGRLLTVFGCGGDRDRTKRPLMGEAAARDSEVAIVTSDNPRTEDPASIIAMVVEGARRTGVPEVSGEALEDTARGFCVIADRRTAIRRAVAGARPGDVLVIAGKGHEDYQIVGQERLHFDDREEAAVAFVAATPPGARS